MNAAADAGIARGRRRLIRRNSQHAVHSTERVSAQELAELLSSQRVAVIDVREPMEYALEQGVPLMALAPSPC